MLNKPGVVTFSKFKDGRWQLYEIERQRDGRWALEFQVWRERLTPSSLNRLARVALCDDFQLFTGDDYNEYVYLDTGQAQSNLT